MWKHVRYLLYSHNHNNTTKKKDERRLLKKNMYLSLYCKICMWEGVGDRTETAIFWPHSYGRQRRVFLVLLMLNRRSWGPLYWVMAFFTASYQQLLWTPTQSGAPSPFGLVWLSLPHLVYNSVRSLSPTETHQGLQEPLRPDVAFPTTPRL